MIPKQTLPSLEQALSGTLYGNVKADTKEIVMLEPSELIEIEDQPFRPYISDKLLELAEDIEENGQINPCTIRKKDGKYIILAGRNRKKACELAGVKVACIIIECDDPTANLILVNSNLNQRQELLPSEKAFAYKLQKESYEAKGQKKTSAAVAEQNSENVKMIQRYIKLTKLTEDLLDMVDNKRLPIMAGVELAGLNKSDMQLISSYLTEHTEISLTVAQAQMIFKLSPNVSVVELENLLFPEKAKGTDKKEKSSHKSISSITFKIEELQQVCCGFNFPNADKSEIKEFILMSLKEHFEKHKN